MNLQSENCVTQAFAMMFNNLYWFLPRRIHHPHILKACNIDIKGRDRHVKSCILPEMPEINPSKFSQNFNFSYKLVCLA